MTAQASAGQPTGGAPSSPGHRCSAGRERRWGWGTTRQVVAKSWRSPPGVPRHQQSSRGYDHYVFLKSSESNAIRMKRT